VLKELAREELCVTELARLVELSQSCTTRHLQALGRVGAVLRRRDGKRVVFKIAPQPRLAQLMDWIQLESRPSPVGNPAPRTRKPKPSEAAPMSTVVPEASPVRISELPGDPSIADDGGRRQPVKTRDLEDFLL
jgi:DNA-binding transcriptional ArsR family regulator